MAKKAVEVKKVETKKVETKKAELTFEEYRLEKFKQMRCEATTPEKLKEVDFWIAHYKNLVENQKKIN